MPGLRVTPAGRRGRERLQVSTPDGLHIAWYDREAARVHVLAPAHQEAALDALAPFLAGPVTVGPPPVPTRADLARLALHPDDDLAPNRPGEALLTSLDRTPARRRSDPRRHDLAAQLAVGQELDSLESAGWRALHSVPLPGGGTVDHLLIGPGGVYCLRAVWARRQRVRITDQLLTIGRAAPVPLVRAVRYDAERAWHALTAEVRPTLAFVGATDIEQFPPLRDVTLLRNESLSALSRTGGVLSLKPADVEALHALARDRRTWLGT